MNKSLVSVARVLAWLWSKVGHMFGDSTYLRVRYGLLMGKSLDLNNPQTFSEKLQWLKLFDRRPVYTTMVDKYAVKDYVASIIGEKYIIPTLGVWDKPEFIDWDKLPNQFVLKTTHGGGSLGVVICKDKKNFDQKAAVNRLKHNMKESDWRIQRERPYKNVPHRIIAEEYIEPDSNSNDLPDYKWFCFNGEPMYCQVIKNRSTKETIDFFDTNWRHQEFVGLNPNADCELNEPNRPIDLEKQIQIARLLSKNIPFVRVDLYSVNGQTLFGEMTFYPYSGYGSFRPEKYNLSIGKLINLDLSRG